MCPLTYSLLRDPVTAEDGRLYERRAIERWLSDHSTSPVTRQPMGVKLLPAVQVRSLIECIVQSGALPEVSVQLLRTRSIPRFASLPMFRTSAHIVCSPHATAQDDAAEWHRERAAAEADAAVRRRAEAGSGEDLAQLAEWSLCGTHDEMMDTSAWLRLAIRAAGAASDRVRLDDERYTSPRARPSLAMRLLDFREPPRDDRALAGRSERMAELEGGRLHDINESMRRILVDWLVDVQREFNLTTYTLFLAVHFLDLYLSEGDDQIGRSRLQLAGVACLRLAELTNESCAGYDVHSSAAYADMTASAYTPEQVDSMQATVCRLVGDRRLVALSRTYLDGFGEQLRDVGLCRKAYMLAKYLLELTLLEVRFMRYSPLVVALAALRLAAFTIDQEIRRPLEGWTRQLKAVDELLERSHCFMDHAQCVHVDDCVTEVRALHVDASDLRRPDGEREKLHAIYDKYGGDGDPWAQAAYASVATEVRPAVIDPPSLASPPQPVPSLRRSSRLSAAREGSS